MKLVCSEYGLELELEENKVQVLLLEKQEIALTMTESIWKQSNGEEGIFILSDADKIHNIAKEVCVILNVFDINCNDRKILSRLYQEIALVAQEQMYEEVAETNGSIVKFLEDLLQRMSYDLDFQYELDILGLMKLYEVKIGAEGQNIVERLIDYIRCMHQICRVLYFVFAHLKQYLNTEQLKMLYEFAMYEKVFLILIEGVEREKVECEKYWILDKDMCIIDIE